MRITQPAHQRRNNILYGAAASILLALGFACSYNRMELSPEQNLATQPGILSIWSTSVKDKGKKFDVNLHLRNEAQTPIIILQGEMECGRGTGRGSIEGDRMIGLLIGQAKSVTITCKDLSSYAGPFFVRIRRVLESPAADRRTIGKEIAKGITWSWPRADQNPAQ